MTDSTLDDKKIEEPALTRLVSSEGFASSKVKTWQLNCFDVNEPEKTDEIPEALYRQVQAKIEPELKQQAELLKKEAYDSAYKIGHDEGFLEGAEKGRIEAKEIALQESREALSLKTAQLDTLLCMLKQPYGQLEEQVLSELTGLALHVAHSVIQKELLHHKEWVFESVQEAIKALPDDSTYLIELHPDDLISLKALEAQDGTEHHTDHHAIVSQWNIKENTALLQGTCLLKQGNSSVLNCWQARFDDIAKALLATSPVDLSSTASS